LGVSFTTGGVSGFAGFTSGDAFGGTVDGVAGGRFDGGDFAGAPTPPDCGPGEDGRVSFALAGCSASTAAGSGAAGCVHRQHSRQTLTNTVVKITVASSL
jgi:hypothetical protein